jgi:hypothetical protein
MNGCRVWEFFRQKLLKKYNGREGEPGHLEKGENGMGFRG